MTLYTMTLYANVYLVFNSSYVFLGSLKPVLLLTHYGSKQAQTRSLQFSKGTFRLNFPHSVPANLPATFHPSNNIIPSLSKCIHSTLENKKATSTAQFPHTYWLDEPESILHLRLHNYRDLSSQ